jgi:Zn-dependent alcohol dehydrogenase
MFKKVSLASFLALGASGAFDQAAAFTTAVTDISADVAVYGGALVGVAAIGVVFMVAVKYLKKISPSS